VEELVDALVDSLELAAELVDSLELADARAE
jgi:hypothetical protein